MDNVDSETYVAKCPQCGALWAASIDCVGNRKRTNAMIASAIRDGLVVEKLPASEVRKMRCQCTCKEASSGKH